MLNALRATASILAIAASLSRLTGQDVQSFSSGANKFVSTTQALVAQAELWTLEPAKPAPTSKLTKR
jgi:ABC-type transport system involved in cytochrome c biogenesis ATPase subunit